MHIVEINDVASVASEIGAGLRARGNRVTLIQPRLVGAQLHPWLKPSVSPARALEWFQLIRTIRQGDYDLAHIHYAYLGMLGVLGRFPFILHCHGTDLRETTAFTRPLIASALRHANHVFYSTPDLADYVLPIRPDGEFLPNPIDLEQFQPLTPAREYRDVYICCSLTEAKGAGRILKACRLLAEERPEIQITTPAQGPYEDAFRDLPNVTLIQHQPRGRLPEIISRHGVVIGQIRVGAIGMAELEALACGRPVVTWFNQLDAYPEPTPFVRAVDGRDIATVVAHLVDDPDAREQLGKTGREWVERCHPLERAAARVAAVGEQILARVDPPAVTT